jgi:hypothetical protein
MNLYLAAGKKGADKAIDCLVIAANEADAEAVVREFDPHIEVHQGFKIRWHIEDVTVGDARTVHCWSRDPATRIIVYWQSTWP